MANDDPQFTAILIFVPAGPGPELKRPVVEQLEQPVCRPRAKSCFPLAAGRMCFGGVDVGNPDLDAIHMKRVAVDDTIFAMASATEFETRCGRRFAVARQAAEGAEAKHCREDEGERGRAVPRVPARSTRLSHRA